MCFWGIVHDIFGPLDPLDLVTLCYTPGSVMWVAQPKTSETKTILLNIPFVWGDISWCPQFTILQRFPFLARLTTTTPGLALPCNTKLWGLVGVSLGVRGPTDWRREWTLKPTTVDLYMVSPTKVARVMWYSRPPVVTTATHSQCSSFLGHPTWCLYLALNWGCWGHVWVLELQPGWWCLGLSMSQRVAVISGVDTLELSPESLQICCKMCMCVYIYIYIYIYIHIYIYIRQSLSPAWHWMFAIPSGRRLLGSRRHDGARCAARVGPWCLHTSKVWNKYP